MAFMTPPACKPGHAPRRVLLAHWAFGRTITVNEAAQELEDHFLRQRRRITFPAETPATSGFCAELLKKMKDEGIHGAVDTCGNVSWSAFESVLPYTDLFLYDFKCADTEKHRRLNGCGNELILENLKKLDATGKNIEIRMMLAPEQNMAPTDLQAAGKFLAPFKNISAIRLLAYHSLARSKFRAVGHPDTMPDVPSPDAETLERAAEISRSCVKSYQFIRLKGEASTVIPS